MNYKGIVQKGGEYGRRLGFPTANIVLHDAAVSGIFAARVNVAGHRYLAAVYADQKHKLLEAHILDFRGDVYGEEIEIELVEKIREDQSFASEDEARDVIAQDVAGVRAYFTHVN